MAEEELFKELEKIREALSESLRKLNNGEITPKEANAFSSECGKRMKEVEKKLKELREQKKRTL